MQNASAKHVFLCDIFLASSKKTLDIPARANDNHVVSESIPPWADESPAVHDQPSKFSFLR